MKKCEDEGQTVTELITTRTLAPLTDLLVAFSLLSSIGSSFDVSVACGINHRGYSPKVKIYFIVVLTSSTV